MLGAETRSCTRTSNDLVLKIMVHAAELLVDPWRELCEERMSIFEGGEVPVRTSYT